MYVTISSEVEKKLNRLVVLLGKPEGEVVREAVKFKLRQFYEKLKDKGGDVDADVLS